MKSLLRISMAFLLGLVCFAAVGCGNPNEANFTDTPGSAPPDAPQTPEEYLQKYPVDPKSA